MADGRFLLEQLSERRPDENGHDTADDRIRMMTREFCKPCEYWFEESVPVEEMFPLALLPFAEKATCFGLQLKHGTIRHGSYWRRLSKRPNPPPMFARD